MTTDIFKAGDVYKLNHKGVWATFLMGDELMGSAEEDAILQLRTFMEDPGIDKVTITPDFHLGYHVPIGTTVESEYYLYPPCVGNDPACGVSLSTVDYDFGPLTKPEKREILNRIEKSIGIVTKDSITKDELLSIITGHQRPPRSWINSLPTVHQISPEDYSEVLALVGTFISKRMLQQVNTIGEGNHYLSVEGSDKGYHIFAHFGSRNFGAAGARYFDAAIKEESGRWGNDNNPGNFVHSETRLGRMYYLFQTMCLEYASWLHHTIHQTVAKAIGTTMEYEGHIPHNFIEHYNGRYVGRKGSTPAREFDNIPLLIPGSMSTNSYVLRPGPNASKYGETVAHGAGRVMGRRAAKKAYTQEDANESMGDVMGNFRNAPIDEAAFVYKDIHKVVDSLVSTGVATVDRVLTPVMVVKG